MVKSANETANTQTIQDRYVIPLVNYLQTLFAFPHNYNLSTQQQLTHAERLDRILLIIGYEEA